MNTRWQDNPIVEDQSMDTRWQDDPIVEDPSMDTRWQDDPIVGGLDEEGEGLGLIDATWGELAWPYFVVLGVAVLGIVMLIRTLRTRKPLPAISPKAVSLAGGSKVNNRQRTILIVAGILIGLMMLYPPFQLHTGRGLGYAWLFFPPLHAAIINTSQLLVQWVAVLLIGGIAFVLSW